MPVKRTGKRVAKRKTPGKSNQRNIAVYLGYKTDLRVRVLDTLCKEFRMTRSAFFRTLYYQYLQDHGLMDKDRKFVKARIKKLNKKLNKARRLMPAPASDGEL